MIFSATKLGERTTTDTSLYMDGLFLFVNLMYEYVINFIRFSEIPGPPDTK